MKLWDREKKLVVVEVEPGQRVPDLDTESRESVLALASHPGFRYLLAKLKFEKAALQTRLLRERLDSPVDVAYLQGGVYWAGWLEEFLRKEVGAAQRQSIDASEAERRAFEEALKAYEEIG